MLDHNSYTICEQLLQIHATYLNRKNVLMEKIANIYSLKNLLFTTEIFSNIMKTSNVKAKSTIHKVVKCPFYVKEYQHSVDCFKNSLKLYDIQLLSVLQVKYWNFSLNHLALIPWQVSFKECLVIMDDILRLRDVF